MNTEAEISGIGFFKKPRVFVKSITFNDNTVHELTHNNIVVFTGANNSGKTRS